MLKFRKSSLSLENQVLTFTKVYKLKFALEFKFKLEFWYRFFKFGLGQTKPEK